MESIEISGKTVEDAIQQAIDKLGVSRDELKITVLKEGKSGILGIGAEEAKILVEQIAPQENTQKLIDLSKSILEDLLKLMSINAQVTVENPLIVEESGTTPAVTFNIAGDDDVGILIGRHGQTISSLQYILRVMIARRETMPPPIIIDVDGYKMRRYEALRATAKRLAEQVKSRKTPFTLEPMSAFERRIIHLTLANDPGVSTQSIGEGDARKVVISPKNIGRGTRTITNR
jgi:spoIIIJ-associated protein